MPSSNKKHLLIDGYNIIHAWPELKKTLTGRGIEQARSQLAQIVRIIHDLEGMRVTIVFDGKGSDIQIERPTPEQTFSFLYSPSGVSADIVIEQLVSTRKKNQEIIVATEDNMIRLAVAAAGASVMGAENLAEWVNACQKRQTKNIQDNHKLSEKLWKQQSPWDDL